MKFERRAQRQVQIAVQIAFAIFCALFAAMFIGSRLVHANPTSRWLVLFGPLILVIGVGQIVNADQIINNEWHAATWMFVRRSPAFRAALGIGALVFGLVSTLGGLSSWSTLPWFN